MKAEIISIGNELLLGETVDTNAAYLAGQLCQLGIAVYWVSQVGDDESRLVEVLGRAWQRSELVLTSGGLGPTGDDLTREGIAKMLGEKLTIEPSLEKGLRERFIKWGMAMPLSNLNQAMVIPSARPIDNTLGSAPGWWVERDGRRLVAMPGPPRELQEMWQKEIKPRLSKESKSVILPRTFKTYGLSEAAVGELVSSLMSSVNPVLGIYAKPDGILVRLVATAANREEAEKVMAGPEASVRKALGDYIWGVDDETLETAVGRLLVEKGLNLAIMEDYSGGWLTAGLDDVPESHNFLRGGVVTGSDEAKKAFGVDARIISQYGAVSPEVAENMAEAARKVLKADIGLAITGLAETAEKPAGIVYIGIANGQSSHGFSRPRGKRRITAAALVELRKQLLALDE